MPLSQHDKEEHATKLLFITLFLSVITFFSNSLPFKGRIKTIKLKPFDLALLGIATHRLGRIIAYDKIADPLRLPFAETVPDESGAGKTTVPRGEGVRKAVGELITCPICAGTWVATGLIYGLHILPKPTRALIAIMSITGVVELLNALVEALNWFGLSERKQFGEKQSKE